MTRSMRMKHEVLATSSFLGFYMSRLLGGQQVLKVNIKEFPRPVFIRKDNPVDVAVIKYVFFQKFHLPPTEYKMPARPVILDLGSNIGLTINHLKTVYPESTILGFEMDSDNYALALKNCEGLSNVKIFNNAVWKESSTVMYDKSNQTDAYRIEDNGKVTSGSAIESITIDDIIKKNNLQQIDFLKMDIEGAEEEIFNSGKLDWLDHVRSMNVEFHELTDAQLQEKIDLLKSRGFHAMKDTNHWCSIKAYK